MKDRVNKRESHLLGVGLDNEDGHKRITKAEKFSVIGGSEETHERITETLVKTCSDLDQQGRPLENVESQELADLIQKNTS